MRIAYIISILVAFIFGILADRVWIHSKRDEIKKPVNPIPEKIPTVITEEYNMLKLYLQEWQVIIETQMHFNDLILRFRSITLTAFITLIGITVAIEKVIKLSEKDIIVILVILAVFWITTFIIDFCYYHRLLLGSVAQAMKFDKAEKSKTYGLFGMTECISEHVHPPTSKLLVFSYYVIPFVAIALLFFWRFKKAGM